MSDLEKQLAQSLAEADAATATPDAAPSTAVDAAAPAVAESAPVATPEAAPASVDSTNKESLFADLASDELNGEAPSLEDVDAPFLSDAEAGATEEANPFEELAAQAKAEEEGKTKKSSKAKAKKPTLDLKGPVKKLEPKDPSEVPLRWYILQAFSGYEQRVAQALKERIKIHNMDAYFGEILVPKEKVKDNKDGKSRESERKFFPGYVMVQMKMTSDSWQLVKHTERVLGFIGGTPERPLPITEREANLILDRLKLTADAPRPKTLFEVGEQVRAIDGAFKDFSGIVEKVDYEKSRLTVSIAIFGRATPVELEFSQVEKES